MARMVLRDYYNVLLSVVNVGWTPQNWLIHVSLNSRIFMMIHNENRENSYRWWLSEKARARRDEIFRIILIPVETSALISRFLTKYFIILWFSAVRKSFKSINWISRRKFSSLKGFLRKMTHNFILTFTLFSSSCSFRAIHNHDYNEASLYKQRDFFNHS